MPRDAMEIFTDGSCEPNPGPGGWGFAVYRGGAEVHCAHGGEAATTNNRMELTAVIGALRWLAPAAPAIVWSDSQYVVRACLEWRHGWRKASWTRGGGALANADLRQALDDLLQAGSANIRWTRGHAGTPGNERADELAAVGRQAAVRRNGPLPPADG
ncbi:ribonuclease HI [Aureimonas leprariae]|uniref:ribonuclease H n=2 Tax=Plantimonas leprariae TaxID=2615207 RepID=A0A7V7TVP0_9HYPH|nr:ribonuclease HI [Aureimonas leprariae]